MFWLSDSYRLREQKNKGFNSGELKTLQIQTWVFPKIGVPPNHPILIGFSIINHPFWGIPIFGNTHMGFQVLIISFLFSIMFSWS